MNSKLERSSATTPLDAALFWDQWVAAHPEHAFMIWANIQSLIEGVKSKRPETQFSHAQACEVLYALFNIGALPIKEKVTTDG